MSTPKPDCAPFCTATLLGYTAEGSNELPAVLPQVLALSDVFRGEPCKRNWDGSGHDACSTSVSQKVASIPDCAPAQNSGVWTSYQVSGKWSLMEPRHL